MSEEEKKKQKERLEKFLVEVDEIADDREFVKQMEFKVRKKKPADDDEGDD